jgi:hypothetical protein
MALPMAQAFRTFVTFMGAPWPDGTPRRRAGRRDATSADELYAMLARGLPNAAHRSAFLRALGGARVEPSLTAVGRAEPAASGSARTMASGPVLPSPVPPATIPADAVTAAQTVLAFFVGPIARVLARDAATQAVSAKDFVDRLCAHVPKPEELTTLRRRLRAEVEVCRVPALPAVVPPPELFLPYREPNTFHGIEIVYTRSEVTNLADAVSTR